MPVREGAGRDGSGVRAAVELPRCLSGRLGERLEGSGSVLRLGLCGRLGGAADRWLRCERLGWEAELPLRVSELSTTGR